VREAGDATCTHCGSVYTSNHGNTACILSNTVLISVAAFCCAMVAGAAVMLQSTFKFGNRNVSKLMALAKHQASMSRKNISFTPSDSMMERSASLTGVDLLGDVKELRSDHEVEAAAALDAVLTEAHIAAAAGGAVDAAAASAVGPHRYCPPRHPTHFKPWFLALHGNL